jgi:hypothetical protein
MRRTTIWRCRELWRQRLRNFEMEQSITGCNTAFQEDQHGYGDRRSELGLGSTFDENTNSRLSRSKPCQTIDVVLPGVYDRSSSSPMHMTQNPFFSKTGHATSLRYKISGGERGIYLDKEYLKPLCLLSSIDNVYLAQPNCQPPVLNNKTQTTQKSPKSYKITIDRKNSSS